MMQNNDLLKGLKVIDFTHRLPGPLCGNLLAGLGASVTKIEDETHRDAFLKGLFADMDDSFTKWYGELNDKKDILRFDFKSTTDCEKIKEMVNEADCLIMGLPPKVQERLGLTQQQLTSRKKPLAVIELIASFAHSNSMHDLNALAETGLLQLFVEGKSDPILSPPFLPLAGMALGAKGALDLVSLIWKAQREEKVLFHQTSLIQSTQDIFASAWPLDLRQRGVKKFLHNGLYPCYSLYKTKDAQYVALAAVEQKFWVSFCESFSLSIEPAQRFKHDNRSIFNQLSQLFINLSVKEVKQKMGSKDLCLSIIEQNDTTAN